MTAFLIDTHAVLWFLTDDPQLSDDARDSIESDQNIVLVSSACVWEAAIKRKLGKLKAPEDFPAVLRDQGFASLEVNHEHAWRAGNLPLGAHKDPFDRLLAAQALTEDLPVISNDAQLDQYRVKRRW